ncbi:hypothetical protein CCAX7_60270 [Capsulimonas corticalis]|uniref:Uncharacterized protein n=1 Tax=Capsulimonas corticalis TaxID=2219043 RepID=A0A402CVY8_9BACT|nr:hypothetical protein [Capsulimonas corticalis]BDI33976.1 hypothetical protein CCAX7_60270 [Capsulimonas corticalis]
MKKLSEFIPASISHPFEKLSSAFYTSDVVIDQPGRFHIAKYGRNSIEKVFEDVRVGLIERDRKPAEYIDDEVFYALGRIKEYLDDEVPAADKIDEKTGAIFVAYLRNQYDEMREFVKDFDASEASNSD